MRRLVALAPALVALVALVALGACSGGDDDADEPDAPGTDEQTSASQPEGEDFEAVASGDAFKVCTGHRMTNAAELDRAAPAVVAFEIVDDGTGQDDGPFYNRVFLDPEQAFTADEAADAAVDGQVSVVACVTGIEVLLDEAVTCEGEGADDEPVQYQVAPVTWQVSLRTASTAEVLVTDPETIANSVAAECPDSPDFNPDEVEYVGVDTAAVAESVGRLVEEL